MKNSLNDWLKEFYPVAANNVKGGNKELLEHSLKKWKGATKENTKTYNCEYSNYNITAKGQSRLILSFGHTTCALCQVHKHEMPEACWAVAAESAWTGNFPLPLQTASIWYDCRNCIIVLSGSRPCPTRDSAYAKSIDNPAPMINLLEELLQKTNEGQQT